MNSQLSYILFSLSLTLEYQKLEIMSQINAEIAKLQESIQQNQSKIKELRLQLPQEEIQNYKFTDLNGNETSLLDLFGDSTELLLVHNMGKECRYCTMWADGFRGLSEIISDRMPWVLTSPNDHETLRNFSNSRGWNFNVVSYAGSSFALDLGFASIKDENTSYEPGVSALIRKDDKIFRVAQDSFGPGDLYNPAWHFFDLFPEGVNGWYPKYDYKTGE